jgi:hypothetical protein
MPKPPRKRTAAVARLRLAERRPVRTVVKKKPSAAITRASQREERILTPEELKILRLERKTLEALNATMKGLKGMKQELAATLNDLKKRIDEVQGQLAAAVDAAEDQSVVEDVGDFLWDVVKTVSPVDLGGSSATRPGTAEDMMLRSLSEQLVQVQEQYLRVDIEIKRCLETIQSLKERDELARGLPHDSVLRAMARYRGR